MKGIEIKLFKTSISVAFFGAVGGVLRMLLQSAFQSSATTFPFDLIIINLLGSFLLGVLTGGLLTALKTSDFINVGLTTGLMGGFTTFSTFILSSDKYLMHHQWLNGGSFLVLSVFLGVLCAFVGQASGKQILHHYRKDWE